MVAEPVCVAQRGVYESTGNRSAKVEGDNIVQVYEAREDGKTNTLTTVQKDNMVAEPVRIGCYPSPDGTLKNSQGMRLYSIDGKSVNLTAQGGGVGAKTGLYAVPIDFEELTPFVESKIPEIVNKYGYLPEHFNAYNKSEIIDKSPTMTACVNRQSNSAQVMNIIKSDGKQQPIYEVRNGLITIKDKQYPIKLADGFYIIRKLTVTECCRLQGMPDWWFDDADGNKIISNTQCYKGLGNGWQLDTVKHIMSYLPIDKNEEILCLSLYDGIGTGRRILEELGYTNVTYAAYEIDKYCVKLTSYRYPSIIHKGDAFQVRNDDWRLI